MFPISLSGLQLFGKLQMELALVSVEAKPLVRGRASAAPTPEGRRISPLSVVWEFANGTGTGFPWKQNPGH